jgi:hypothetical protein
MANAMWIKEKAAKQELALYLWFFDIESGQIFRYSEIDKRYIALPN